MKDFRWGIIGTGSIAKKFAIGLESVKGAVLVGIGSRDLKKAEKFKEENNVKYAFGSYQELVDCEEIDAVYIATPHTNHRDSALLALNAKKHVLCEKPITINRKQLEELIVAAKKNNVFLMEAMWTRFLPATLEVCKLVRQGKIGEIKMLDASFGFIAGDNCKKRLVDPQLGGGALLDLGVYTVSFASMIMMSSPTKITSLAHINEDGIDQYSKTLLEYKNGGIASLTSSLTTSLKTDAYIFGSKGNIYVPNFINPKEIVITIDGEEEKIEFNEIGNGYNYEAEEVMNCVREGATECMTMPLIESVSIMATMDEIRKIWGMKYPME